MYSAETVQLLSLAATAVATVMLTVVATLQLFLYHRQSRPRAWVFVDLTTAPDVATFVARSPQLPQLHARIANLSSLGIWVRELEIEIEHSANVGAIAKVKCPAHVVVGAYDKQSVGCHDAAICGCRDQLKQSRVVEAVIAIRAHYLAGGRWRYSRWQKFSGDLDAASVRKLHSIDT